MAKARESAATIEIARIAHETATFCVVGTTPFLCNAMSAKARRDLILPPKRKSKAEKESSLKHSPLDEYRRSAYRSRGDSEPTRIEFPSAGFKRAMGTAALEIPGVNKTQINRLAWVNGPMVGIYGVPQLSMMVVRSADMGRTPDVRTRAIVPEWAVKIRVQFVTPNLNLQSVANLLASAGIFVGVGDGRAEKGALTFGCFAIVSPEDERFQRIVQTGGREAQDAAFAEPTFFDIETEELFDWWQTEARRRGFEVE
jgi:hypothetical protein